MRLVEKQRGGMFFGSFARVVAEAVGDRLENGERCGVGLLLRGVGAAGFEGNLDVVARFFRRGLDGCAAGENDEVGERDFLAAFLRTVEVFLNGLELGEYLCQFSWLVDFPIFLRLEADASAIGAAALVAPTEGRGRSPGGVDELRDRQTGSQDFGFQRFDVLVVNEFMIDGGNGVLPDQLFLRNQRAEVARDRTHVAVGELEPGAGEGVGEFCQDC